MNVDQIGLEEALAGVKMELAALRAALEAIEGVQGESLRRTTALEAGVTARVAEFERRSEEICTTVDSRLADVEQRLGNYLSEQLKARTELPQVPDEMLMRLEALDAKIEHLASETTESRQFVAKVRNSGLLRLRRKVLQRLHG